MNLYRPVSIFKNSTELENYILDLSIVWNNTSYFVGTSTEKGAVYLKNIVLNNSMFSADVEAVHPITGELFSHEVSIAINKELTAASSGPVAITIRKPADNIAIQSNREDLIPTVCIFDIMPSEMVNRTLTIKVKSPITVSVGDTLHIGIDDNYYIAPEKSNLDDIVCLRSINGISPVNGNILITGAGALTVSVEQE